MRTISSALSTIYASRARSEHVRLDIDITGAGSYQDMTSYLGHNWIESIEIKEQIDGPCKAWSAVLRRAWEQISLAPLMERSYPNTISGSYVPILGLGRAMRIYAATLGADKTPATADWTLILQGTIDGIAPSDSSNTIALQGRDSAGVIIDTFIEDQIIYGDEAAGTLVESAMQDILDDNGLSAISLYTPSSPGWYVMQWAQDKKPVMQAVRDLALQIGYDVRYKWHAGTSAFRLTFYEPDRSKATADRTFGPDDYYKMPACALSIAGIRNAIKVVYLNNALVDPTRASVTKTDATSISQYGRRWCEISEEASGNIDSSTEATKMADAALADLAQPDCDCESVLPLFWPVELGDLYDFESNKVQHDQTLSLAVVGYTHTWKKGSGITHLTLRGKPSGGFMRWLAREHKRGTYEKSPITSNDDIGLGMSVAATVEGATAGTTGASRETGRDETGSKAGTVNTNPDFNMTSRDVTKFPPDGWKTGTGTYGTDVTVSTTTSLSGKQSLHLPNTATATVEVLGAYCPVVGNRVYTSQTILQGSSTDASDAHKILVRWYTAKGEANKIGADVTIYNGRATGSAWTEIPRVDIKAPATARWARLVIQKVTH